MMTGGGVRVRGPGVEALDGGRAVRVHPLLSNTRPPMDAMKTTPGEYERGGRQRAVYGPEDVEEKA